MNKMTIEEVLRNIRNIRWEMHYDDLKEEIIIAFEDYEFENETSVIVSTQWGKRNNDADEIYLASIDHPDSPQIEIGFLNKKLVYADIV